MRKENALKIFQEQTVRTHWDDEQEKWFFSIVDVIAILAVNSRSRKYWSDLKKKLKDEGSELSENIGQLKMLASDGKMRLTDVADTAQLSFWESVNNTDFNYGEFAIISLPKTEYQSELLDKL